MKKLQLTFLVILGLIFLLRPSSYASGVWGKFEFTREQITEDVLRDTIGVVYVRPGTPEKSHFQVFTKTEDNFMFSHDFPIFETKPLSTFGYHPASNPGGFDAGAYPVTQVDNDYIEIVLDASKNTRVWVRRSQHGGTYPKLETYIFVELDLPMCCITIFFLSGSNTRSAYNEPIENSQGIKLNRTLIDTRAKNVGGDTHMTPDNYDGNFYEILDINNGFVLIRKADRFGNIRPTEEPIGWVKIRDKAGNLTLWIVS